MDRYYTVLCNFVTRSYLGRLLNNIGYSLDEGLPVAKVFRSDLLMILI